MTDAERTSAQAEEQEQTTGNGGLLSNVVETARNVVETVTETAKGAVETVVEHTAPVVASAAATVGDTAGAIANRVRRVRTYERTEQPTPAAVEQGGVEPEARPVAVSEETTTDEGMVAEATAVVADIATAARKRVARVYGALTTAERPEPEAGARYEPPAEGGARSGRPRRFKDVQPGMQLQGKVTSIALYGIFVDVGVGRDGLVHISEMSDKRIDTPTDLVQIGSPVEVWVKSVDPDARRISLTMRDPNRPKPERSERRGPRKREINRERLAEMKAGDTVDGVVSSLAPFGAFVDLGVGKDGLVHVSELAEGRVERPEDAVQVGERYTFKVLEVDPEGNRISLSLRRAQRSQRMQQLETGVVMEGTISGIAPFGAFVDIGVGRDGLVHVSEISSERISSVADAVKVGDQVQVMVIEVDTNSKRISLTMRVDEPLPNERERPAPRAASPRAFTGGPAPSAAPAPSYADTPSFGGPPPFEEGRGGDRRGPRRASGAREGGGREGGRTDFGRAEGRGSGPRRDRPDRGGSRPAGGRGDGGRGGRRESQAVAPSEEVYTFEDPEETFDGDATLEDLVSKFNAGKGRDRRQSRDDDEDDTGERRAEAIRRTLALRDEE